jgi:2-dehydro-3-deoxyphosphogluconate aldolase/(4S)-4-hydroxy-2-oxoglutarate aldolase
MSMKEVMKDIRAQAAEKKIVPVVKLDRASDAKPLADALIEGGLPVAEVTFRTDAAEESIRQMAKIPGMLVGAGTVTNLDQAQRAIDAGASFIVTPGFSPKVTEFAADHKMPIFPGVSTPTELMMALEFELPVVKFFPAEQYGGLATIKALAGPFPSIQFMPTGGINAKNILDYLSFKKIIACGGSWMVKDTYINEGNFAEIVKLTREAVELVK